ncbi:MAG: FAD-binding protein [Thermodesulfobacteriota bacterium]|nr:FAD-binding protein [Thermodesulfobacteriota bacterium]
MISYRDPIIAPYTSMKIGGVVSNLYIPESESELIDLLRSEHTSDTNVCVLGHGSNTIFDDHLDNYTVINTKKACPAIELRERVGPLFFRRYRVYAGASVPLQGLIRFCAKNNLEAPAYLYSVPGNVGGSVVTNAGKGEKDGRSISDFITSVAVFDGNRLRHLEKKECQFAFRDSIFQKERWVVLGAMFEMKSSPGRKTMAQVRERMAFVKRTQDRSHPNAGSVFKRGFRKMPELMGFQIGNAAFSKKTPNWILNLGGATARDVKDLIAHARRLHETRGYGRPKVELHIKSD